MPDQFCNARSAALLRSAETFTKLQGVDVTQVQAECSRIAESMQAHRLGLLTAEPDATIDKIAAEFKTAGVGEEQTPQAISNFTVCLGVGYANDQAEVVISAALGLVGLGETGYGELVAGGLALGAGTEKNSQKAVAWLDYTAAEIEAGAAGVAGRGRRARRDPAAGLRRARRRAGRRRGQGRAGQQHHADAGHRDGGGNAPRGEDEPETGAADAPATGMRARTRHDRDAAADRRARPDGDRKKDAQAFFEAEKAEQASSSTR